MSRVCARESSGFEPRLRTEREIPGSSSDEARRDGRAARCPGTGAVNASGGGSGFLAFPWRLTSHVSLPPVQTPSLNISGRRWSAVARGAGRRRGTRARVGPNIARPDRTHRRGGALVAHRGTSRGGDRRPTRAIRTPWLFKSPPSTTRPGAVAGTAPPPPGPPPGARPRPRNPDSRPSTSTRCCSCATGRWRTRRGSFGPSSTTT